MSDTFFLGALLAVVGGFLDAYTYLVRGHVFANAQTGNIVLLGLNLAEGNWMKSLYYLIPILCFALGVVVAEFIRDRFREHPNLHWRQIILAAEILVLCCVGFLPLGGGYDMLANVGVSFLCSIQVEAFRKVNGNALATTMCTGNLRSGTEQLYHYFRGRNPQGLRKGAVYFGIILFFVTGAVIGTLLTNLWKERAVLCCCVLLIAAFAAMFIRNEECEEGESVSHSSEHR